MVQKLCENEACKAPFESHACRKRRFCSRACMGAWKVNRDHHGAPLPTPATERPCETCGALFRPLTWQVAVGYGLYCSRKCSGEGRRKAEKNSAAYKTRAAWYQAYGWANLSRGIRTDVGHCEKCGQVEVALNVHHKEDPYPARSVDLLLRRDNLVVLCEACHGQAHSQKVQTACETCQTDFLHPRSRKARFCSLACRDAHPDFAAMPPRSCGRCGRTYQPIKTGPAYCGITCSAAAVSDQKKAARPSFTCPCGRVFTMPPSQAARPRKGPPTCSRACRGLASQKHA